MADQPSREQVAARRAYLAKREANPDDAEALEDWLWEQENLVAEFIETHDRK